MYIEKFFARRSYKNNERYVSFEGCGGTVTSQRPGVPSQPRDTRFACPCLGALQLIVAAACFLAAKAQDAMRLSWAKQVAGAYFEVKNANKPAELQAFKQDPVGGSPTLISPAQP